MVGYILIYAYTFNFFLLFSYLEQASIPRVILYDVLLQHFPRSGLVFVANHLQHNHWYHFPATIAEEHLTTSIRAQRSRYV